MTITLLNKYSLEKYSKISFNFALKSRLPTNSLKFTHEPANTDVIHKIVVIKQTICFGKTLTFLSLLKTDVSHFIRLKNQLNLSKNNLPDTSKAQDTVDKLPVFFFVFLFFCLFMAHKC